MNVHAAAEPAQDHRQALCDKLKAKYDLDLDPSKITYMGKDGIDYDGIVNWSNKNLTRIPVRFRKVTGYFSCSHNHLTTLAGAPGHVGRDFYCYHNHLTNLEHAPGHVGVDFVCSHNHLTNLEHAPGHVGGDFYCSQNRLTTLAGAPDHVGGGFYCSDNNLPRGTKKPVGVKGEFVLGQQTPAPVHGAAEPTLTLIQQLHRIYERPSTTYTTGNVRVQIARTRGTGNTVNVPTLQVTLNDGGLRYLHKIVCVDSYDNELRIGDLGGRLGPNVIGKIKSLQHMLSVFVREYKELVRDWDHPLELRRMLKKAAEKGEVVGDVEFREGSYRGFPYICARFVGAVERVLEFAFVTNDPERTLRTYTHPGRGAYLELSLKQLRRFRDLVDVAAWFREVAPKHFRPTAQAAAEPENTTNFYDPGEFNAAVRSLQGKTLQIGGTSLRLAYERRYVLGRPFPVLLVVAGGSVLRFENLDSVISVYASKPKSFLFRFSFAEEEYDIGHTPQQLLKKLLAIPYKGVPVIKQFLQEIHSAEAAAEPAQDPREALCAKLLSHYGVFLEYNKITYLGSGGIDYDGSVNWSNKKLSRIPVRFRSVTGYFYCDNNHLTTLEHAPVHVGGGFYCDSNHLTTLEHAPAHVGRDFICSQNHLTTLEHAPGHVGGGFYCNNNHLTTLAGAPGHVGGGFYCDNNRLTTLEHAPGHVGRGFFCYHNRLPPDTKKPVGVHGQFVFGDQTAPVQGAVEPEQSPELSQLQELLAKLKGQEVLRIRDISVSVVSVSLITSPRPSHPVLALVLGIHGPAGDVRGTTPYHVRVENGKYTVAESNGNILGHVSVAVGARGILSVAATHLRKHLQDVYDAYAATEPTVNMAESFVRDLQRLAGQVGYIEIEGEPVPLTSQQQPHGTLDFVVVKIGDVILSTRPAGPVRMLSRGKEEELTGNTTAELSRKLSEFVLKHTESLTNPFRKLAKQLGNKTIKLVIAGVRIRIHYQEPYIIAESDKHKLQVYSIPGKVVVRSGGYPGQTIPAPNTKELALNLAKAILDLEHGVERGR